MQYRKFGKTNEMVSVLGFGMMRLPLNSEDYGDINEELATEMVRKSIDEGVNYIDTAVPYHEGKSEAFTAKVLKDGYREKVFIATKLPSWAIESREDMDRIIDEQLDRLETDYIDFYLIHYLRKDFWKKLTENGLLDFMDSIRQSGKVKHIGFSFHDDFDTFKTIVDGYDWEFCQIQLNILDVNAQAGIEGLKYASSKGLGVSIMEPLRGGSLVDRVPEDIMEIWQEADPGRSPVSWALDFLYSMDEVSLVLSGMSHMSHVEDNLRIADQSRAGKLSDNENKTIERVRKAYEAKIQYNCTLCKYCLPCPKEIYIPYAIEYYNNVFMFENFDKEKREYWDFFGGRAHAGDCIACGECMTKCPQKIEIIEALEKVHEMFGSQ